MWNIYLSMLISLEYHKYANLESFLIDYANHGEFSNYFC